MKRRSNIVRMIVLASALSVITACSGSKDTVSDRTAAATERKNETTAAAIEGKNETTAAGDVLGGTVGSYVSDKQLMLLGDGTSGKTKLAFLCDRFVVVVQMENPIEENGRDYVHLNQREQAYYETISHTKVVYYYDTFGLETPTDFQAVYMDNVGTVNGGKQVIVKEDGDWMIYYCEKQPDVYYMANQFACFGGPQWLGKRCESLEEAENLLAYVKTHCKVYKAARTDDGKDDYTNATDSTGNKLDTSEIVYVQDRYVEYVKKHSGCTFTKDMTIFDNFGSITYECGTSSLAVECEERTDMERVRSDEDNIAVDYHGMTIYASKKYDTFYYEIEVNGKVEVVRGSYYIYMGDESHNLTENSPVEDKIRHILDTFM